MSSPRSASCCTFTFSDGRRCRSLRQSGHPLFCTLHARRLDRINTAAQLGRELEHFFSGRYLSACDLNTALGRLFAATVRGHVPAKTTSTLAYLAQVMVQCIHLTANEYSGALGGDAWRKAVSASVNSNFHYISPSPVAAPPPNAPAGRTAFVEAGLQPGPTSANAPSLCTPASRPATSPGAPESQMIQAAPRNAACPSQPASAPPVAQSSVCDAAIASPSSAVSSRPAAALPPAPGPSIQDQPNPTSVAPSVKSQLKQLLISELPGLIVTGAASSQPMPSVREAANELMEDMEEIEDLDEDHDDDLCGLARNPAARRRSWRERVGRS